MNTIETIYYEYENKDYITYNVSSLKTALDMQELEFIRMLSKEQFINYKKLKNINSELSHEILFELIEFVIKYLKDN